MGPKNVKFPQGHFTIIFPRYTARAKTEDSVDLVQQGSVEHEMKDAVEDGPVSAPRRKEVLRIVLSMLTRMATICLVTVGTPSGIKAQGILNPLVPVGRFRLGMHALLQVADSRFGERLEGGVLIREEEPLGLDFSDAAIGSRIFPTLEALEESLQIATAGPVDAVVLGMGQMVITQNSLWVPIRADVGILDWLTIGALVPFSRRSTELAMSFREDGATVGLTPTGQAGNFLSDLLTAESDLTARVQSWCSAGPSSTECITTSNLLTESQEFHRAIRKAYSSHGVFPLDGSVIGTALQSRLSMLLAAYQAAGVASFPADMPFATTALSQNDYKSLVTPPSYGVGGFPIESWWSPWRLGDVELYANARLFGSGLGRRGSKTVPKISYLLGAGALARLGTGRTDHPDNFFDTGSGDGQTDVEVSIFGSVAASRWSIHSDARYGIQNSTLVVRRVAGPDRAFPGESNRQTVSWTPGKYWKVRVAPLLHISNELAVAFDIQRYSKASDMYEPSPANNSTNVDLSILELETKQATLETGGGIVFSTLRAGRGHPLEIRVTYRRVVSGSGGRTPKMSHIEFGLRLLGSLWN